MGSQDELLQKFLSKVDYTFVDEKKFESQYQPKIDRYLLELEANQPLTLKLPQESLPKSLESKVNAIEFIQECGALTLQELMYTSASASEIVSKIACKSWKAVDVFKAFSHRAVIGNQLTNFASQFFIDEGLARAKFLDEYLEQNGKTIGPLHGLPMSLKEHLEYGGKVTHSSYVSEIENISEESCATVKIFEKLGCVFYVRTSQPQTIMHLDTNNNINGRTKNPNNLSLSPGGSSGGEGAIVSIGGSPIGIGSDIGGSIRAPSSFCGIFGFKPTTRRMSLSLPENDLFVAEAVIATLGPIGKTPEDLNLFMETYINHGKPWMLDPWALRIPWKKVEFNTPESLKIGVLWDDGIVKPFPAVERGLKYVVESLGKAGFQIIDFKPPRTQEAYDTVHKMYTDDGNSLQRKYLSKSGEPLLPLTKWFMTYGDGDKELSIGEINELTITRNSLRADYLKLMNELGIDFLISPTSHNVAPMPNKIFYWGYTSLFNILDMPVMVFPSGLKQDPKLDTLGEYKPRNLYGQIEMLNYSDPSVFANAPISFQLIGRRYFDEEVLACGKLVAKILKV